jgi:glutaredoxin
MNNVTIYTKDECSFCYYAKKMLDSNNINYTEYHLGLDFTRDDIKEKFPSQRTFPIILVDDELIGGYIDLVEYMRELK